MTRARFRWLFDFLWSAWEAVACRSTLYLLVIFALFLACFPDYAQKASSKAGKDGNALPGAFQRLVSGDEAKEQVLSGVGFILVWLVGGGLLVGLIVRRCHWLDHGGFRRCRWLLKDHLVVLGWDDGLFSDLLKARAFASGCYVLTNQDAFALQVRLRRAGLKDVCVYAGDYDDPVEWGPLNLACAQKVFVSGEGNEEAHDARVLMVSRFLERSFPESKFRDFRQVVNVRDFGLANRLLSKPRVKIENFHLKWGWHLIDELPFPDVSKGLNLFVAGSGAMGQAVVWAASKKYGNCVKVVFTDDDEEKRVEEQSRFLGQTWDVQPEFCKWEDAQGKVFGFCEDTERQDGRPLVVVVAKKRPEKGCALMMDLQRMLEKYRSNKIVFALDQEIEGWAVNQNDGVLQLGSGPSIRLFGFKRGCTDA